MRVRLFSLPPSLSLSLSSYSFPSHSLFNSHWLILYRSLLSPEDQLCGVGLSVRFKFHLITVWHRDASKQKSIDGLLECVMKDLPVELQPRADNYFYKKHADHEGFKVPPELQGLVDAQKRNSSGEVSPTAAADTPQVSVQPPQ